MKRILLIFDDSREMEFIETNLIENGFEIYKTSNPSLKEALDLAKKTMPDLIVVNMLNSTFDLQLFNENLKSEGLGNTTTLSLTGLKEYLNTPSDKEHFIVKPIRPKLLLSLIRGVMNNEEVSWVPSLSHS